MILIPISLKYVTKEPFALSYLNFLSVGLIALTGLGLLTRSLQHRSVGNPVFTVCLTLFLLGMLNALLATDQLRDGIGLWTSRLTQPLLVGYCAYLLLSNRLVKLDWLMKAFLVGLLLTELIGLAQWLSLIPTGDPGRLTGAYQYPNTFARYLDIVLALSLPWLATTKPGRLWWLIWLTGIAILLGTISYNGVLTFYLSLILFLLLGNLSRLIKRLGLGLLIGVGALTIILAPSLPKYQTSVNDSRLTRLEFWQVAWGVTRDHPWTGIGIKGWEQKYNQLVRQYVPGLPRNWGSVQPHNVFLDALVKGGIPALIGVVAMMLWPIFGGYRLWRSRSEYAWLGLGALGYGVAMFWFGLIDDPIWSDDTVPILFIVSASLLAATTAGLAKPELKPDVQV